MGPEPTIPAPSRDSHPPSRFVPPTNACDAHCHIFGPAHRFPFSPTRTYTPPDSGIEEFESLQERIGLARAVFVQAGCHGTDNSALIDALRRGGGRYAGVAMIDESHSDDDLAELHESGVRGIRFNFVRHLGGPPEPERVWCMIHRVARLGWHVELHFDPDGLARHADLMDRIPVSYVIDHMARVDAGAGLDQEPFRLLLRRIAHDERAWVKISGAERITADGSPPYDDVIPFARALIAAAPQRVLWGTDWPHPNVPHMPDDGDLVDLLADFAPDEEVRNMILVENPTRLYDFS